MAADFRTAVERRTVVMLTYLSSLPRVVPFAMVAVLLLAGLMTTGILAFVALSIIALFLGLLLYVGWPEMAPAGRVLRLLATLLIGASAVNKLFAG